MNTIKKIFYGILAFLAVALVGVIGIQYWLHSGRTKGEAIGAVNTAFHITGSDQIVVEAYDDPLAAGVTCYVSRARKGGIRGTFGIAEDVSEASIACRQTADKVTLKSALPEREDLFTEKMSAVFKEMHVTRMVDPKRNVLLYLTYSDKVFDGSPKNSLTAVPVSRDTPIIVK